MTKMKKMLSVGLVGCMSASAMMMGAGAAQLTDACDVEDAASAAVDNAVSPYIVGTQFSVSGSNFLPFNIPSTKKVTKSWVMCETGRGPVSYTHLGNYRPRRKSYRLIPETEIELLAEVLKADYNYHVYRDEALKLGTKACILCHEHGLYTVSYTHLDVYKRQS